MFACENCIRGAGMGDFEIMTSVRSAGKCEVGGAACEGRGVCYDIHHSRWPMPEKTDEEIESERRQFYDEALSGMIEELDELEKTPLPTFGSTLARGSLSDARLALIHARKWVREPKTQ